MGFIRFCTYSFLFSSYFLLLDDGDCGDSSNVVEEERNDAVVDESAISRQGYFVDDIQCVDCYLLLALNSMDEFVNGKFTPLVTCNGECAESSDILSSFVEVVFHQIDSMDLASIQSLEHVKRNIREILNFCKGYGTFFASFCKNVF